MFPDILICRHQFRWIGNANDRREIEQIEGRLKERKRMEQQQQSTAEEEKNTQIDMLDFDGFYNFLYIFIRKTCAQAAALPCTYSNKIIWPLKYWDHETID